MRTRWLPIKECISRLGEPDRKCSPGTCKSEGPNFRAESRVGQASAGQLQEHISVLDASTRCFFAQALGHLEQREEQDNDGKLVKKIDTKSHGE